MSNWQFIVTLLTLVLAIFGASWLNTDQMDRFDEMGKRFDAQIESVKAGLGGQIESVKAELRGQDRHNQTRFATIEEGIREIKNDLKRLFQPILPS